MKKKRYSFLVNTDIPGGGYWVFENKYYMVGKPTKFRDLTPSQKKANAICISFGDHRMIVDTLNHSYTNND